MAVTLEELVVKIQADVSQLQTSMKAATDSSKNATEAIKKGFDNLSGPIKQATGALDAFKGGLAAVGIIAAGELIKKSLEGAEAIQVLSENTGIATDKLQGLSFAAAQSGVSQEELNSSLMVFNRNVGLAVTGNQSAIDKFTILGIRLKETNGSAKSTEQLMAEVADRVGQAGSQAEKSAILFEAFGRGGTRLVKLFGEGSEGLDVFQKKAQELGIIMDAGMIKGAAEASDKFNVLARVIQTQVMKAVVDFAPTIDAMVTGMISLASKIGTVVGWLERYTFLGQALHLINKNVHQSTERHTDALSKNEKEVKASVQSIEQRRKALEELTKEEKRGEQIFNQTQEADPQKEYSAKLKALELYQKKAKKDETEFTKSKMRLNQELFDAEEKEATKQVDELLKRNQLMSDIDSVKYSGEIEANKLKIDEIIKQETQGSDAQMENSLKLQKFEEEQSKRRMDNTKSTLSYISTLQNSKSKELAAIGKAAAIATATIDGFQAVQKALASAPPPFNFVLAALVGAATGANIAGIAGVQLAGGIDEVPGSGNVDNFPAILMPGERVVPKDTNRDLKAFLNARNNDSAILSKIYDRLGKLESTTVVNVGGRQIIREVNRQIDSGKRLSA